MSCISSPLEYKRLFHRVPEHGIFIAEQVVQLQSRRPTKSAVIQAQVSGKVKFALEQATKANKGSGGIALLIL